MDRINNEKICNVKYLLLSAFFASEFLLKMNQSAFEFFTSRYVHQRIVDYVDDKQVVNVRIDAVHSRAIHLEVNAPVNNNAVHCDGESAEPERKNIDGHAESGANFKSIEFGAVEKPGETERVVQLRVKVRRKNIACCIGRSYRLKCWHLNLYICWFYSKHNFNLVF
jgi:hypothetical protein